eukprot:TRINITY_DN10081_c0_g1_i2.p2 TRINITY_DN10081_c0_g1~~TRINITY_DN10081_c0_g1_i2.p2  ORF type:complete len:101 (+),score=38.63 TRINITY_DN10081_c0_g1_i2:673-975(+)
MHEIQQMTETFKETESPSIVSLLLSNGMFVILLGVLVVSLVVFMGFKIYAAYKQNKLMEEIAQGLKTEKEGEIKDAKETKKEAKKEKKREAKGGDKLKAE